MVAASWALFFFHVFNLLLTLKYFIILGAWIHIKILACLKCEIVECVICDEIVECELKIEMIDLGSLCDE